MQINSELNFKLVIGNEALPGNKQLLNCNVLSYNGKLKIKIIATTDIQINFTLHDYKPNT